METYFYFVNFFTEKITRQKCIYVKLIFLQEKITNEIVYLFSVKSKYKTETYFHFVLGMHIPSEKIENYFHKILVMNENVFLLRK